MCAMMPMFRVFSSEYCRCMWMCLPFATDEEGSQASRPPSCRVLSLPAVMREGLVGLRHLVRVLALLDGRAAIVRGVEQLGGELVRHAALRPSPRRADQPAHRQ